MDGMLLDSFQQAALHQNLMWMVEQQMRPSVVFRPRLTVDGNCYCFLLGEDIQSGVAGFGETAALAADDFDKNFISMKAGPHA